MSRPERGAALLAALLVVAVSAAVAAALATLAHTEITLARNRAAAARTLAAADACLATITTSLPAGWEFAGAVAPPAGCAAALRPAPGPVDPPRALLDVTAVAGGGRRALVGVLDRTAEPGVPALVWLGDAGTLGAIDGTLELDGADPARPDPLAALAAPADPTALDGWLAAQGARLALAGPVAAPIRVPPPPLAELADRLAAAGATTGGALVATGIPPPLALTLVPGHLEVATSIHGRGVLFVDGRLDIDGSFEFSGVLVASGGIRVAQGARLEVLGTLWLGPGAVLELDGVARVAARADHVAAADSLLRLPRRARLAGLRDVP